MSALIRQSHANNDTPLWASASAPAPAPAPAGGFQSRFGYDEYPAPYLPIIESGSGWTPMVSAIITPTQNGNVSVIASARLLSGGTNVTPQMTVAVSFFVNTVLITETVPNAVTSTNGGDAAIVSSQWSFPGVAGTPYVVQFVATTQYISPGVPGFLCESALITLLSS